MPQNKPYILYDDGIVTVGAHKYVEDDDSQSIPLIQPVIRVYLWVDSAEATNWLEKHYSEPPIGIPGANYNQPITEVTEVDSTQHEGRKSELAITGRCVTPEDAESEIQERIDKSHSLIAGIGTPADVGHYKKIYPIIKEVCKDLSNLPKTLEHNPLGYHPMVYGTWVGEVLKELDLEQAEGNEQ